MKTVTMRNAGVKETLDTGVRYSEEICSFPTVNIKTNWQNDEYIFNSNN
jgi:hypothetical protein